MKEEDRMARIRAILKTLPLKPGVYLMHDESGKVIYVGKAKKLKRRVSSYFNHRNFAIPRLRKLVATVCDISFIRTETESEAFIVESRLIKAIQPFFNVELKMGSRYPFIVVTSEKFPRIQVTHTRPKTGRVFGPYTSAGGMRNMLTMIKEYFPLRNCTKNLEKERLERPCIMYDIGKCLAPCAGKCTEKEYNETVDDILLMLNGQTADLVARLRSRMESCAKELKFEEAAKARDAIRSLWKFSRQKLSVTLTDDLDEDTWLAMTRLQELIGLPVVPWRIDGFDISHSSGHETYGVAVVFEQGYPNQSLYRRYAIKTVEGVDDFRSMRETVLRRYRGLIKAQLPMPQLITIDGGPEQLAFARAALDEVPVKIPTVALAKRDELIFTEPDKPPLRLDWNDPALRLLQRVRDESHRYAITTHRKARLSRLSRSALEDIPGIGKHKAASLLSTFGSVQRIATLTAKELQAAPGIGKVHAGNILKYLSKMVNSDNDKELKSSAPDSFVLIKSGKGTQNVKYDWKETVDVPYVENGTGEDKKNILQGAQVRKTYNPKRKKGIHRA